MKFGFCVSSNLPPDSGGSLYDRYLNRALEELGHSAVPIDLDSGVQTPFASRPDVDTLKDCQFLLQDELLFSRLTALNRGLRGQARAPNIVGIVHALTSVLSDPAVRTSEQEYLDSLDTTVFVSDTALADAKAAGFQIRNPWVVVPGRDHLEPRIASAPRDRLRLLQVGALHPVKGQKDLLNALKPNRYQNWTLTCVGSGPRDHPAYARSTRSEAQTFGDQIRIQSAIAPTDMAALYAEHHALIISSPYESFGMAALEAQGCGLPVISWAQGGIRDQARSNPSLMIVPTQATALGSAIETIADPLRWNALSERAKERYQAHPTWQQSASQLLRSVGHRSLESS